MKKSPAAILRFHGVRGSRPVHDPHNLIYGGNSTCIEFDTGSNYSIVVDGGSGLQNLSALKSVNPQRKKLHILITHTHWDHVLMLPFLRQLESSDFEIHFYAPDVAGVPFKDIFHDLMKPGRLPIPKPSIKANLSFNKVTPGKTFIIEGKVKVVGFQVNHQHITLGYKISYESSVAAIIPDIASIEGGNLLGESFTEQAISIGVKKFEKNYQRQLIKFLEDVPNVVFDTHFNQENLKADWGHATPEFAMDICSKANVKRLFMFHHAPEDLDHDIAKKQMVAQRLAVQLGMDVINAREEDEWPLTAA